MKIINDIKFSFFIVALSCLVFTVLAPYFPVDETRYLTVAWEMRIYDSFIVPLLNGLPYSHKPPFLFWLINLDWFFLGVNEKTLRIIPLLFSLLNIVMVYKIALVLWDDKKIANNATIILSSMLIYLIWSALIMFEIILTFWVLVGILGLLLAIKNKNKISWMFIAISVCGGLITKGPVIFIHIFPVIILSFFWIEKDKINIKKWYLKLLLSILTGISISLLWVIPAVITGGETYREAILWGQTANRVISSFAHNRPAWWYIPLFPILFFPWILIKSTWFSYSLIKYDKNYRFLIVWILSTVILFSLISGKQIYYLIPLLPAVSLLVARNIGTYRTKPEKCSRMHYPVAIFYIIFGFIIILLPFVSLGKNNSISINMIIMLAVGLILLGCVMLFINPVSVDKLIKTISLSSIIFIVLVFTGANKFFCWYDLSNIAKVLKEKQEANYKIIHYGKYYGQYQFLGRLTQPLIILKNKKSINEYIHTYKKVLLIIYKEQKEIINKNEVLYKQPYRGAKVLLLNKKGINNFLKH